MLVVGFHAVGARLKQNPDSVVEIYVEGSRNDARMRELVALAKERNKPVRTVSSQRIDSMCPNGKHQGVVAQATAQVIKADLDSLLESLQVPPFLLLLDGVTDPRNLGACLRVADGAGVHAVIAPKDKSGKPGADPDAPRTPVRRESRNRHFPSSAGPCRRPRYCVR